MAITSAREIAPATDRPSSHKKARTANGPRLWGLGFLGDLWGLGGALSWGRGEEVGIRRSVSGRCIIGIVEIAAAPGASLLHLHGQGCDKLSQKPRLRAVLATLSSK